MDRVSPAEYAKAVISAIRLAQQPTSGGQVAAQVLLSCYNGDAFQLDVSCLRNLDRRNYEICLQVIRGRYDTGIEPHSVVKDGSKVFRALWAKWERLEISERAKCECPDCGGRGAIFQDEDNMSSEPCKRCSGTGRICKCYL